MKNNLLFFRKQHKLSQEELASALLVTRQTIISIESGKYNASLELALKIAKFFKVPVEDIFFLED